MKQFCLIAIIIMNTSFNRVIDDPYHDLDFVSADDILVFNYDDEINQEIEVVCPEGQNCKNGEEVGQNYSITPEFHNVLDRFLRSKY